ncbi:MAG: HlyD family efflux transporter periplasmic adaptor subunit [Phycisphaerales bacterium]
MSGSDTATIAARPAEDFARASDLFAKVRQLAADQSSPAAFVGESFRTIAQELGATFALLRARVGPRALDDYWHSGPTDPGFWKPTVESSLDNSIARAIATARLYRARDGGGSVVVIASPMPEASGEVNGAIGLVLACDDDRRAHELLAHVRAITAMIPVLAAAIAHQVTRETQAASTVSHAAVQALAVASNAKSRTALAIAITNQLRTKVGCEQVALAAVRGKQPRLLSISGFADVSTRSPGVAVMIAAMCEALDYGRPVCWNPTDNTSEFALHRHWSGECEGAAVATIPLRNGEQVTALLSLRHGTGRRFGEDDLKKIHDTALPYAAALDLVHQATRSIPEHVVDSSRRAIFAGVRARNLARTSALVLAMLTLAWFAFGTTTDRATARCRIAASSSVHLAAPFDGTLREARVVAGDSVAAGQVIARFDTTELELERSRLTASIEKASIEADAARSRGKQADAMLIDAKAEVDRVALRAVERKIDSAVLRAPSAGMILTGDLRRSIGSAIPMGQSLFEFAPDGELKVELAISDRDIARVRAGAVGEFVSTARPDLHIPIKVARVRPASESREGQNVFVAEAAIEAPEAWMRAGVDGFARVDAGTVPVWKAYLRRSIDFVRMHLWV